MNKGVVLEKHKRFMIVMTDDGEFIKAKVNDEVDVGDETPFIPMQVPRLSTFYQNKRFVSVMAAAVILMVFLPMYQIFSPDRVYGFVTIDINPSLEFRVNSNYDIIGASGYNEEGRKIMEDLHDEVIGQPLNVAVGHLINKGNEWGYLTNERDVYISSSMNLTEELWGESYDSWMQAIQQKYDITFITLSVDPEMFEEANKLSLSPAKFVFLRDAQQEGLEMDVNKIKNISIDEIEVDTGKKLDKMVSPEKLKITAPVNRGKPENPGNSNNKNRSDEKEQQKKQEEKKQQNNSKKNEKENENKGRGNNQSNNDSKDDQHPSEKKSENSSKQKEDHPSSLKGNNSQKETPGNSVRNNQRSGNNANENATNNRGNSSNARNKVREHPHKQIHPRSMR